MRHFEASKRCRACRMCAQRPARDDEMTSPVRHEILRPGEIVHPRRKEKDRPRTRRDHSLSYIWQETKPETRHVVPSVKRRRQDARTSDSEARLQCLGAQRRRVDASSPFFRHSAHAWCTPQFGEDGYTFISFHHIHCYKYATSLG
jgi:hypothetical protein